MLKVNNWLSHMQSWLLPDVCVLCGTVPVDKAGVCNDCAADLPRPRMACARCGVPLASDDVVCGRCLNRPPLFDRVCYPFLYDGPVVHLVHALKFNGKLHLSRTLGELLADHIVDRHPALPERLVPVPLHPRRLRERGFNQALEVARRVSRRLDIPLDFRSCTRTRFTPAQSSLPAKERQRNVKGTFSVAPDMTARHVVIVDDVMTTGATANELARTLKKAGVTRVDVWVCAHAPLNR